MFAFLKKKRPSLPFIAFFQATGLVVYCVLVGLIFWRGDTWFGSLAYTSLGPTLLLILFSASVLVCGFLALGYPIILFWERKQRVEALKLVGWTAAWLLFFILVLFLFFASCK